VGEAEDVARFLAEHRPFDRLPPEALARAAAATVTEHYPPGATILQQGAHVDRLHVVARGQVELRSTAGDLVESIGPGEVFGQLSLLVGTPMLWRAVAGEDTACHLVPRAEVEPLRGVAGFEATLVQRAGERIRHAITLRRAAASANQFTERARDLIARPLVTCGPQETIRAAAERYRVDRRLVQAVIAVESAGNPGAVSRKGAQGLMQLMPQRSAELGVQNPFDPRQNVDGGVRHLRDLLQRFAGNVTLALAAYNAGEAAVRTYQGIPPYPETQDYVRKVRALYDGGGMVEGPPVTPQQIYRQVTEDGTVTFTNLPPRSTPALQRRY